MISRGPFGSDELNPLCAKGDQGWAGTHSTGSWEEAGRQTGRHVCAQTVRQLLAPLSVPTYCPYWHLPSALNQEECTKAGSGRAGQPISPSPSLSQPRYCPRNLPSVVCSEQAGLWRRRERSDGPWARPEMPSPLHPVSPPTPIPAKTQAEALPTGTDLVLGLNVCEVPCVLAVDAQHPVSHGHTSLCSFASRSELGGGTVRGPWAHAHPSCTTDHSTA